MKLKQYIRYQLNFKSNWVQACSILMGLSFFACLVYYFAITTVRDVGVIEYIAAIFLGVILCGSYVVCITCLRMNAPGLYAIMGALQCLMLFILNCTTGDALRIVLSVIWYALAAIVLLATAGGYLPGRLLAALMFFVPVFIRIVFYDIGRLGLLLLFRELFVLCTLAGIGCLAMGFVPGKLPHKQRNGMPH